MRRFDSGPDQIFWDNRAVIRAVFAVKQLQKTLFRVFFAE
jgi:hypothetical protein